MYNPDFPPEQTLQDTFSEQYYLDAHADAFRGQKESYQDDPSIPAFVQGLERMEGLLRRTGKILDVGSAFGTFLKIAQSRGWEPYGVELSEYGSSYTRKRHGFEIFTGDLAEAPYTAESFDCITFWDVIEHVQCPVENLHRAYALLKPGGLLLVTTDNFDCLISDVGRIIYTVSLKRFSHGLERLYIPYNRTYFTEQSCSSILAACGFRMTSFEKMEYPLSKIKLSRFQRPLVFLLYMMARAMHREAQFTIIATKPEPRSM